MVIKRLSHDYARRGERLFINTVPNRRAISLENMMLQEQVRAAQAKAVQAEKLAAIGRRAANVAHEVSNSLSVILMATSLALAQVDKEAPGWADLETIREEARRLRHMTKNLLNFARPSQLTVREVEVNAVVRGSVELFHRQIELQDVECRQAYTHQPLMVLVNENQMVQVFHNLLANALGAIPEGGQLTVSTRSENRDAVVEVKDNGVGIAPQNLDQLFEPFFTTKLDGKGTGLGLSISYDIVAEFGGGIEVKSQLGEGSTFTVRLPMVANLKGE